MLKVSALFFIIFSQLIFTKMDVVDYSKISNKNGKIYVKDSVYTGMIVYKRDREFYVNGVAEGKWLSFYPNGQLKAIENWKKGELNGKYVLYNDKGIKIFETCYLAGKNHGIFKLFHDNGKPHIIGQLRNGENVGIWSYYDENGKLTGKVTYKK